MDTASSAFEMVGLDQEGQREVAHPLPALPARYFEDMEPGLVLTSPPHRIDRDELVKFAQTWDPMPFHIDEQAGLKAFGSLTAPGLYMLATKQRLIHQLPPQHVIASLGYDEVRFIAPLRPDDVVVLHQECMSRRLSKSKLDRGIVQLNFSLINQDGKKIMSHLDTVLFKCRVRQS